MSYVFIDGIKIGAVSGTIALALVYTLEYAEIRLFADVTFKGEQQFDGILSAYGHVVDKSGMYTVLWTHELSRYQVRPQEAGQSRRIENYLLDCVVNFAAGVSPYPIDTIRRRM